MKYVDASVNSCGCLQMHSFAGLADSQNWTGLDNLKRHLPETLDEVDNVYPICLILH